VALSYQSKMDFSARLVAALRAVNSGQRTTDVPLDESCR
jgi:hypothetical protein